jgi:hypothetical protein
MNAVSMPTVRSALMTALAPRKMIRMSVRPLSV